MQDKNQNTGVVFPDENGNQLSAPVNLSQNLNTGSQALSSEPSVNPQAAVTPQPEQKSKNPFVRVAKRADVILAVLLILGSIGLVLGTRNSTDKTDNSAANQFETTEIPLEDLITDQGIDFGTQSVTINGALKLNDAFILSPSDQPTSAVAGQMYYDQTSNILNYYNGTSYVALTAATPQATTTTQQTTGVTSLQGQTGAVTLTAGNGIGINGTTISNSGVVTLVSTNSTLVVTNDGNGNYELTVDVGGAGVTSLNGLAGVLTLANATGAGNTVTIDDASTTTKGIAQFNATNFTAGSGTINTIQNINTGASPTFAGVNTNSITPSAALTVGATGQQLTLQGNASTQLTATGGGFTTMLGFSGAPVGAVTYNLDRSVAAGTYNLCSTVGNCAGTGTGVTSIIGGTANRLAKFTAAQNVENSTITDDGATVTTSVDVVIQGGDVTVGIANSQTGTINMAHSGSAFLGSFVQGALTGNRTYLLPDSGGTLCLTSGNCSGTGSSNTLQAAYDAGNTITTTDARNISITMADTATDANFLVNLECDTACGANGRFAIQDDGTDIMTVVPASVTLGTNVDLLLQGATAYISNPQTQTRGEAFGLNATVSSNDATAVGAEATAVNRATAIGSQASASGNNSIAIGNTATTSAGGAISIGFGTLTEQGSVAIGTNAIANHHFSIALGNDATTGTQAHSIAIGAGATATTTNQMVIGADTDGGEDVSITQVYIGDGVTSTTPNGVTINATGGSGANVAGAALTLAGGRSTGSANGGSIIFQGSPAGGAGSSLNALSTLATLSTSSLTMGTNIDVFLQGATAYISNPQTQSASEAFGLNAAVSGANALAVGNGATAAAGGVALGQGANSIDDGVSIGNGAGVGTGSFGGPVAIGDGAVAASWGVALGSSSSTSGNWGTAIGQGAVTVGQLGTSLGNSASAGQASVALGADAISGGNNRIVIGFSATATDDNQMVVGGSTTDGSYIDHVVFGSGVTDATPQSFTLQGTSGSGANVAGASVTIASGQSTGSASGGNINFQVSGSGGAGSSLNTLTTVGTIQGSTGAVNFINLTNSTQAFNIENSSGGNLVTVDSTNSRVGINLGGNNTPTMDEDGLEVNGSLKVSGTGIHTFTTPNGSGVGADFSINVQAGSPFGQVMALGLDNTSSTSSRALSLFDDRGTAHQPTLLVFDPNENSGIGFNWNGSTTAANVQTIDFTSGNTSSILLKSGDVTGGNGSSGDVYAISGSIAGGTGGSTGALFLQSGNGTGTNSSTGSINLDAGSKTGSGTAGSITIGTVNATALTLGRTGLSTNNAGSLTLGELGTTDTSTFLCRNSSNIIAGCSTTGAGAAFVQGGNTFGATATLGTNDSNSLAFETNNTTQATIAVGGATTFQNSTDSTSAFRVLTSGSGELLGVNSTSSIVRLLNNNTGAIATSGWTTNANNLPDGRFEHASVTANGYAYVIAGDDDNDVPQSTVYYGKINANGSIGTWTTTTALPQARTELTAVTVNGYVYAIGGRNSGQTVQTTVYYAKINSDGTLGTWNTTTVLPVGKTNHTSFAANGYIYAMGGESTGGTESTIYYARANSDGTVGAWNTTTAFASARRMHAVAYANGYVYSMAGDSGGALTQVAYAKVNTDGTIGAWSTTTALPTSRINGSGGVVNGYLYHIGGDNVIGYATVYYAPLNSDGTIGAWTQTTDMNANRRSPTSIVANGYIYGIGGEAGSALTSQEYASPARVTIGGSLDLVSLSGENLAEGGSGGNLTAGNTHIAGLLTVTDNASFKGGATIGDNLSVISNSNSSAAMSVVNAAGSEVFGADTVDSILRLLPNNTGHLSSFATGNTLSAASSGGHAVSVNGYLYLLGGFNSSNARTTTVHYARLNSDGSTATWSTTTALPVAQGTGAATTYNGYIYVNGGNSAAADGRDIYYAKVNQDGTITSWATLNDALASGQDREDHTMIAYNGYLYIIGGEATGDGTDNRNISYARINADGSLGSFSTSTNWLPAASLGLRATAANGYLYVLGESGDTIYYGKFNADGTVAAASTDADTLAANRDYSAFGAMNGYLYVVGGGGSGTNTVYYASLDNNGNVNAWTTDSTTLPANRWGMGTAIVNGYIYSIGGDDSGAESTSVYYASGTRVKVGGSLDLVGYSGESLAEGNTGGQLTAGNTSVNGTFNVTGNANLKDGLVVGNNLTVNALTNSSSAFAVMNATAVPQFSIDTSNSRVYIGNSTSDTTGALLVLDTKSDTGDPTGVLGAMYYNSNRGKMRCFELDQGSTGYWLDCIDTARTSYTYVNEMLTRNNDNVTEIFGSTSQQSGGTSHPGIVRFTTGGAGTDAGAEGYGNSGDAEVNFLLGNGDTWRFEIVTRIDDLSTAGSQEFTYRTGFNDDMANATDATDGCYFRYSHDILSGEWEGVCRSNSSESTCDSNIVVNADQWYRLTIVANSAGNSVDFQTDGTSRCQVTTNIPTGAGRQTTFMSAIKKELGATARNIDIDYFSIRGEFGTSR